MEGKRTKWDLIKQEAKINKPLLPLKAVMFLYYGAVTTFLPYITLHMVQIGITIEEVAIIYAILPFASCVGPPIAGMIADRLSKYKQVLMGAMFCTGIFHTLLLTIDARGYDGDQAFNKSQESKVYVTCDMSGLTYLQWENCSNATCFDNVFNTSHTVSIVPSDCYHTCSSNDTRSFDLCEKANECMAFNEPVILQLKQLNDVERLDDSGLCSVPVSASMINDTTDMSRLVCRCQLRCAVSLSDSPLTCPENVTQIYDQAKHRRGFWSYLAIRIVATAFLGTSFTMLDASTICLIKKHKGDLGKQRLFGVIGSAIFALCSGLIVDFVSEVKGYRDYAITFYCADILFVLVLICFYFLDVEADKTEGNFWRNVLKLIRLVDVDIFMTMMLMLGTCWGFLEAYLFIFLIELNATSYLLGLTVTFGSIVGLPFLYISDYIVLKIGKIGILLTAFFIYCIRFIGYSFIEDPWLSLPFEALEAVTIHLMGVSMSMFCASAAPVGLLATLHGLSGAFHYSIGRGLGSFIGGILIATYGARATFRIIGTASGIAGIIYIVLYFLVMRKYDKERLKKAAAERRESVQFQTVKKVEIANEDLDHINTNFLEIPKDAFLGRRLSC